MKFTHKDFKQFKKHCDKWVRKIAPEFTVDYAFESHKGYEDSTATCGSDKKSGRATIRLNNKIEIDYMPNLDQVAFHEVCHLLLARYYREAGAFLSHNLLDEIGHEIISKLENLLFEEEV